MIRTVLRSPLFGCVAGTVAAVVALAACVYWGLPGGSTLKMVASTGCLAIAVTAGAFRSPFGRFMFAGLALSWWGDLFLIGGGETNFLLGLVAFLAAHLAYGSAFLIRGIRATWAAAGLAAVVVMGAPIMYWLHPHLGGMAVPVYAYNIVISSMLALAIATQGRRADRLILAGALLFYFSDLCVARQKFVEPSEWNGLVGLPLYFAGQILLAISIARNPVAKS